jgi:hypothetical protein
MLACGTLIIELTVSIPYIPKLLIVDVPPMYSNGSSFPSRALFAISFVLFAISIKPSV